jgi:hypothetical protein
MALVTGAWALTWYDKLDGTLNFLRNDKRPLYYCYSEDKCTIAWASELDMLSYALRRRNKKIFGDGKGDFYEVTPNMHMSWVIPQGFTQKFEAPTAEKVEGKQWPANFTKVSSKHISNNTTSLTTTTKTAGFNDNIIPFSQRPYKNGKFRQPYKDMYGRIISKPMFEEMVGEGCALCNSANQEWNEFIHVMGPYYGKHTPYLCEECYNTQEAYEIAQYAL